MKYQIKATIIANPATPPTTPPAIAPAFELEELLDAGELLDFGVAPGYIRVGLIPSKQDLNLTR